MAWADRTSTVRQIVVAAATVGVVLVATAVAASAATPEEAAAGAAAGVYRQPGAQVVDLAQMEAAVADASDKGLDLTVAVLADSPDAVSFAGSLNDLVGGTVLVFTPDQYGAVSSELSQSELEDALDEAGPRLGSDDVVAGVSAFVAAATPRHFNWPAIILVAVVFVAAIGIAGRLVEQRATKARRKAALDREWAELDARADALANPVLALEQLVELADRTTLRDEYRVAASRYGELRDALEREPTPAAVEEIEQGLDDVESRIESLEKSLAERDQSNNRSSG
jgi:hypothetical protein